MLILLELHMRARTIANYRKPLISFPHTPFELSQNSLPNYRNYRAVVTMNGPEHKGLRGIWLNIRWERHIVKAAWRR